MSNSYEEWTRSEIARLRSEAETLQKALDKWLESDGRKGGSAPHQTVAIANSVNGAHVTRRVSRQKGSKANFALAQLKAAPQGMTTDELFRMFAQAYGSSYKRSSLRALLFNQKNLKVVSKQGDRYVFNHAEQTH